MNPEFRKLASETLLHKRGIRINLQLPEIESNDEVRLRSSDDLLRRLIALWAVVGASEQQNVAYFRQYITHHKMESWLSPNENAFLFGDGCSTEECEQFSRRSESLHFLAWCAGLVNSIDIPSNVANLESIMHLFPLELELPAKLQNALHLRSKNGIIDWADLLYRLHWAVRHATLIGKPVPANLYADAVREWHQAVNWLIRYDDEDDWDRVATDT